MTDQTTVGMTDGKTLTSLPSNVRTQMYMTAGFLAELAADGVPAAADQCRAIVAVLRQYPRSGQHNQ
jgi:hypothetical protein